jgi:hypothetical protein
VSYAIQEATPVSADLSGAKTDIDVSVLCLSNNPSLPRHEEPKGPYSRMVGWTYSDKFSVVFEKKTFDFFKTSFFNPCMLVSRKQTHNLFNLASAWQKAKIKAVTTITPEDVVNLDDWNH